MGDSALLLNRFLMVLWSLRICLSSFGVQRRHCWKSEKNRSDQAPENSDGARDTKTGERRVACKSERAKTTHRGQTREKNRLHHAGNIVLDFTCLLPDQHNVY